MKVKFPSLSKVNKTWAVLGTALAIGLLAALATRSFLSTQVAQIEARNRHQTVDIVVAKTDLTENSVLSNRNVAVRKIPVEFAQSGAVSPADFERIDGKAIAYKVNKGEMIMWSGMAGERMPTFSARLAVGQRAITVAVDEINSISGMLEPGDLIDLVFSGEQNGKKMVIPLLQSVQVMATGQRSIDAPKGGERTQFATVTLNATPDQAKKIIVARESGRLTALLRNPADQQSIGSGGYDLMSLFGAAPQVRHSGAPRQGIPVLYGGSSVKYPPEALHLGRYVSGDQPTSPPSPAAAPPPPVVSASNSTP